MKTKTLTAERLRQLLNYDLEIGWFTWRVSRPACRIGSRTGSRRSDGYRRMVIDGTHYLAHRLAWLYIHGVWPVDQIDHVNGDRDDNRLTICANAQTLKINRTEVRIGETRQVTAESTGTKPRTSGKP